MAPVAGVVRLTRNRVGLEGSSFRCRAGRLFAQRPGRLQVVANLARRAHGSQSESRSADHRRPIAATGAAGRSPLRLPEWRISDVHRRISTYIPATLRPWNHPIRIRFSLQIGHFGAIAQLAERLDRTSFGKRSARLRAQAARDVESLDADGARSPSKYGRDRRHSCLPATNFPDVSSIYGFQRSRRRRGIPDKSAYANPAR